MKKYYIYIFLVLACVLFLRFNRQDLLIKNYVGIIGGDHHQYYALVDFFRGQTPFWYADAPFNKRLLVPMIASVLPFERGFAVNLTNALLLYIGFAAVFYALTKAGISHRSVYISILLHIITFPVFYYSVIGFIDASLVGWMMLLIALILREKYTSFAILLAVGVFLKESIIIILVCGVIYFLLTKNYKFAVITIILYSIAYLGHLHIMKLLNYGIPYNYSWVLDLSTLRSNLARPRTYFSFALSMYPSILVYFWSISLFIKKFYKNEFKQIAIFCLVGITLTLILYAYSLFVAYSDGRFLYPAIAFSVVLLSINFKIALDSNLYPQITKYVVKFLK
jgi:hypothetical protein